MNTFALKATGLALFLLLAAPTGASAFKFVDSSATQVNATTYLLTYTYTAGFLNSDALFPIVAAPEVAPEVEYPRAEYALTSSDENIEVATVNALVLSDAAIVDNQYQTKEGKNSTFTLLALVTLNNSTAANGDLALDMRLLPFSYTRDGEDKSGAYKVE